MIYLDANATTPPLPEVVAAMRQALERDWANPNSVHRAGQAARRVTELARAEVAGLLGCGEREVVFTSGGTESADLAIRGSLLATGRRLIVTSPLEHSAVRELARTLAERGEAEVAWLAHDAQGRVDLDGFRTLLAARGGEIAVTSVMAANNETGVLQPVAALAALAREAGVTFHTDATQAVGRMPIDLRQLGIDLLTCSAHKLHGPKGIGALAVRRGAHLEATLCGGPQERGRRGGTENVAGIVGFGEAARLAKAWVAGEGPCQGAGCRDLFERLVLAHEPEAIVHAAGAPRLWNTTNIAFPRLEAEAILIALSERGVAASAGAACSSGSLEPSPVLLAMGVPEPLAHGSVRFSLSRLTTEAEVREAATIVGQCVAAVRASTGHAVRG